jgi:hypothetical protein
MIKIQLTHLLAYSFQRSALECRLDALRPLQGNNFAGMAEFCEVFQVARVMVGCVGDAERPVGIPTQSVGTRV